MGCRLEIWLGMIDYIVFVALCAACISYTICCAGIFKPLREWVSPIHPKIEELIHCPYCLSHYVVLVIMLTTSNVKEVLIYITGNVIYDFLFTLFTIVCIVALLHYVMCRAYAPVAEYLGYRALKKVKENKNKNKEL